MEQSAHNNRASRRIIKLIFGIASAALWIFALFLPAYSDGTPGVLCMLFGWTYLFGGSTFAFLAWFANIPWIVGMCFFLAGKRESVLLASVFLTGGATLFTPGAFTVSEVMQNEGGTTMAVSASTAVFVWMTAFIVLLAGCIINYSRAKE